jgi:hypothetical protein
MELLLHHGVARDVVVVVACEVWVAATAATTPMAARAEVEITVRTASRFMYPSWTHLATNYWSVR